MLGKEEGILVKLGLAYKTITYHLAEAKQWVRGNDVKLFGNNGELVAFSNGPAASSSSADAGILVNSQITGINNRENWFVTTKS